ncbi:MAG: hypothetical protein R2725_03230 [Solirubrobacterales bacterium]
MVALAVVLGLVAWLATRGDDEGAASGGTTERIVSKAQLAGIAANLEQLVYWAGPVSGAKLELIEFSGGIQVRYRPGGTPPAESLTVATYPRQEAEAELQAFAARPGSFSRAGVDGRVVVSSREQPTSVYFVSADGSAQVEVYDPSPERALSLARSVRVRPVR